MTDISYIKWATFSVKTDISLSGLQTIIDSDTSLNNHLKTTNTEDYNIQPTTTDQNYMVYRLKKNWVNDYSYNDNTTHDLNTTDWEQITNDLSMLVPHEAYWLKYKLCQNTNSGTVPTTNVGLYIENGTLKLIYNGGIPLSDFNTTSPPWQEGNSIYFNSIDLYINEGGMSITKAPGLPSSVIILSQSGDQITLVTQSGNARVELTTGSTLDLLINLISYSRPM